MSFFCSVRSIVISLCAFKAIHGHAQSSQIEKQFRQESEKRNEVYESINRMVQNPMLASGLASGTDSINRSVDSLMESIFYSVMDEELNIKGSDTMSLISGYRRDVHPTSFGSYVVVDRFQVGPDFLKNIGNIRGLPLTFNGNSQLFITNANYRSDAQRKAEGERQGFWRDLLANWLGILPLLSNVLPPSFNPQELYDPVTYLQTPFLFPSSTEEALELPIGNVRSYGVSGGASLSIDMVGRSARSLQKTLGLSDLDLVIPLSVFRDAEHRISILRRDESHVWLSLSEVRRLGTSLAPTLGKDYKVLQKLVKWWAGVPAPITPMDFDLQKARIYQIDELFDFDLLRENAQEAFVKALHGDFQRARELTGQLAGQETKPEQNSGVTFQFYRVTTRNETGLKQERSFYVAQSQKQNTFGVGESRTTDRDGEFLTLEAEQYMHDRNWNLLVGADTAEFRHRLSIPVRKEKGPNKSSRFILTANASNPLYMTASLRIIDGFVDVRDYRKTLGLLRRYSGLPMDDAPEIPLLADDVEKRLMREQALMNPMDEVYARPTTATFLGKLVASAHLYFPHDMIIAMARKEERALWTSLAKAFDSDPRPWARLGQGEGSLYYMNLLGSYALMPLRLLNVDSGYPEIALEQRRIRRGFDALLKAREPLDILAAYELILDTSHPVELMQTLGDMAKGLPVPIIVGFNCQAQDRKQDSPDIKAAKKQFESLNDKVFESPWPIPPLKRDQSIEEKLANFTPGGYRDFRRMPKLMHLRLMLDRFGRPTPDGDQGQMRIQFGVQNMSIRHNNVQAYIRIEQHGALNLGRFVLSENIVKVSPEFGTRPPRTKNERMETFQLPLNGPDGLEGVTFIDDAIAKGGSFDMHISLSEDGEVWSPEQTLSFAIEAGVLQNL